MKLALELDAELIALGQVLTGRVNVIEGGPSRSLTLTVSFRERTRDFAATPYSSTGIVHSGELATGQSVEFTYTVPSEALPSVKCEHSELAWELELHSDEPGFDTVVRHPFAVVAA